MAYWRAIGLRGKSVAAMVVIYLLVTALGTFVAVKAADSLLDYFAVNFARKGALLHKERILSPILRELALSRKLADSPVIQEWLRHEDDPQMKRLALAELRSYKNFFQEHSYFIAPKASRKLYFDDAAGSYTGNEMRKILHPDDPEDVWFFTSMRLPEQFNLNVNTNKTLGVTKLWINVAIEADHERLGIAGAGMDLGGFIKDFIASAEPGVSAILIDRIGAIQAHQNPYLIDQNSLSRQDGDQHSLIFSHLSDAASAEALRGALKRLEEGTSPVETLPLIFDGHKQLAALAYLPEIKWTVVLLVDIGRVFNLTQFAPQMVLLALLLVVIIVVILVLLNRIVLAPLLRLTHSAEAIAAGDYHVALSTDRSDEIGQLSRAFVEMADTVSKHTQTLEQRVNERTEALRQSNQRVIDSINCAKLIQSSLLPSAEAVSQAVAEHFVLWLPRDVVGGDLYVVHRTARGTIIGIIDCIGHGVPGAFMSMMVHAVLNQAFSQSDDPATILGTVDRLMRRMIKADDGAAKADIGLDMALCRCEPERRRIIFAGARISLHCCDGATVTEIKGDRRSLCDRRHPEGQTFTDHELDLSPDHSFYLTTDGFLDQSGGGKGYGFGKARFHKMLLEHAALPLDEQRAAFERVLSDYQGEKFQRDDITFIGFRLSSPAATAEPSLPAAADQ